MAKVAEMATGEAKGKSLTEKQKAFARKCVELGGLQSDAYRAVYKADKMSDNAIRVEACRLMANPNVALMVEQLQLKHAKRHDITVESLTEGYFEAIEIARAEKQATALTGAVTALGKLHGLITDKVDHNHKMTLSEEFEGFIREISAKRPSGNVIEHEASTMWKLILVLISVNGEMQTVEHSFETPNACSIAAERAIFDAARSANAAGVAAPAGSWSCLHRVSGALGAGSAVQESQ